MLVNLKNGTFEIGQDRQLLRSPRQEDFLTYQLPFEHNPDAQCPLFKDYLNKVQPDVSRQMILAEYLGYLFIKSDVLKLEKTLLLYGSGANGKSVFFTIVEALLGEQNTSNYSLQSLTNESGYQRAMLANKLVNYSSEINGKLDSAIFKQLVSGEPVEARLPYGNPFNLKDYAKLIFNCNELPKDVEHTHAFFRRFLIVPFDVTIPESEQDRQLAAKIIENELSGVFNWVLEGLNRLLRNKQFTNNDAVDYILEQFKRQSDTVLYFLDDMGYTQSSIDTVPLKDLFSEYTSFCILNHFHRCSLKTFSERLRNNKYELVRRGQGTVVHVVKNKMI